jgi:hypothetical protein
VRGLAFKGMTNLLQLCAGDVVRLGLCVQREKHNFPLCCTREVDDTNPTGLACTSPAPADLSDPTRLGHHISGIGTRSNVYRELTPLFLGPVERPLLLEQESFDYREHSATIRPRRIEIKCLATQPFMLVRVDGDLVNERGRTIGDFRPEEVVFQLEPEDADQPFIIEGCLAHACADMLYHRRFTDLRRTP